MTSCRQIIVSVLSILLCFSGYAKFSLENQSTLLSLDFSKFRVENDTVYFGKKVAKNKEKAIKKLNFFSLLGVPRDEREDTSRIYETTSFHLIDIDSEVFLKKIEDTELNPFYRLVRRNVGGKIKPGMNVEITSEVPFKFNAHIQNRGMEIKCENEIQILNPDEMREHPSLVEIIEQVKISAEPLVAILHQTFNFTNLFTGTTGLQLIYPYEKDGKNQTLIIAIGSGRIGKSIYEKYGVPGWIVTGNILGTFEKDAVNSAEILEGFVLEDV